MLLLSFLTLLTATRAYVNNSDAYRDGSMGDYPSQSFDTHPGEFPIFNFDPFPQDPSPGYLFLAPRGPNVTTPGALILDWSGGLVWDGTQYGEAMDFSVQTYLGNPVLALWTGEFNRGGYGKGTVLLLDQTYTVVANISTTVENQAIDFHGFQITDNDTALFTVYNFLDNDIISGMIQELNISTGEAIFTWDSIDHIPTSDCYIAKAEGPWDYIHLNSVAKDDKGNYLTSSRHCSSVFYIAPNGTVLWSMGGKYSNFTGTDFHWQHDARWHGENTMSVFDNAANSWEETGSVARGVVLDLDITNMSVTQRTYDAPTNLTSETQGSFELLPNGNWLAGWGSRSYVTEFAENGTVLWSAQFGLTTQSAYRTLKANWTGYPLTKPAMQYNATGDAVQVKVSWSGSTEVAYWLLNSDSGEVGRADHEYFEDTINVQQTAVDGKQWVQVTGYNADGGELGSSDRWVIAEWRSEVAQETRTIGTASFSPQSTSAVAGQSLASVTPSGSAMASGSMAPSGVATTSGAVSPVNLASGAVKVDITWASMILGLVLTVLSW